MQKSKKNLLSNLIQEVLYNSLAQATLRIIQTPHTLLKIFLFACILTSLSFASYMVVKSVLIYFSFDVNTSTRFIFETAPLFPKITICNLNPFTTKYAHELLAQINSSYNFLREESLIQNLTFKQKYDFVENFTMDAMSFVNEKNFSKDNQKKLGHSLEDILISCQFAYQTCNIEDFTQSFNNIHGNCFSFNTGFYANGTKSNLKRTSIVGADYGFTLELYMNSYETLSTLNAYGGGLGALLFIENSSYLIDHPNGGIKLACGSHTDIQIDRELNFMLPKPYSACEIETDSSPSIAVNEGTSDLFKTIYHSEYAYSQTFCLQQCFQKTLAQECNCSDSSMNSLYSTVPCESNAIMYNCDTREYEEYIEYVDHTCLPQCPLECNFTKYKTILTSYLLTGDLYVDYIRQNKNLSMDYISIEPTKISKELAAKGVLSFSVFYESLAYKVSRETPKMDVVSLLASVGGNLGLFLGISLFSVCEVIEVLMEYYFLLKKMNFKN